jgi:hypothetical protein
MLSWRNVWRSAVVCVAGLIAWQGGGRAQAQYGGFGDFGFGFGLGAQTPAAVTFLNDHAIARTHAAAAAKPQPLRAPIPVSRDVEFFTKYDAATRRAMEDRVSRRRLLPRAPATETQASAVADNSQAARPVQPLGSFFDKMKQLVWPSDAPSEGDLAAKRSASDLKTSEVLLELEARGYAHLATKADARNKLLDYGRPALQFMRDNSTAAVSDALHAFLLFLYDSIGQAPELRRQ